MTMKLNKEAGGKPQWSQLYDIIADRIESGHYWIGEMMPTEMELADEFNVSRIVVRQAMERLVQEGYIQRRRGKGTMVLERKEKLSTSFISSLDSLSESDNYRNRKLISFKKSLMPVECAYLFDLPNDEEVYCLIRYTYIKDKIVNVFETYLHPKVQISDKDDASGSLYDLLKSKGVEVTMVTDRITAGIMSNEDRMFFDLNKKEAIIYRHRIGYSHDQVVEYTYSKYIAEGYQVTIENR